MYFFLILFFASLLGIIFMLGWKLHALDGLPVTEPVAPFPMPRFDDLGDRTLKILRRLGYLCLVASIRFYVKISLWLKNKYTQMQVKLAERHQKSGDDTASPKISNKFLRVITESKRKISRIKAEIKEEETNS